MELGTLLTTSSAAIDMTGKLAEIVRRYQDSDRSDRMAGIILELKQSALEMARDFNDELQQINKDFFSSGIDTSLSITELNAELKWYNFVTRSKINGYQRKFESIYTRLAGFLDDVTAIAICNDDKTPLSHALNAASERTLSLTEVFNSNTPLEQIFNTMQLIVREIYDQMQGGELVYA